MAGKKMYRTEQKKGPLSRLSFAHNMRKPQKNDKGVDKYGCTFIVPKADVAGLKILRDMVAEVISNEWGEKGVERFKQGLIKNPILEGDGKSARAKDSGDLHPGMGAEVVFIRATSNEAVKVFNKSVRPATDDEIKSGYWGYPVLNAFAWHNEANGDGISFGVSMVQLVKEDEVLAGSGGGDPDKFFERISEEGDTGTPPTGDASGLFD